MAVSPATMWASNCAAVHSGGGGGPKRSARATARKLLYAARRPVASMVVSRPIEWSPTIRPAALDRQHCDLGRLVGTLARRRWAWGRSRGERPVHVGSPGRVLAAR